MWWRLDCGGGGNVGTICKRRPPPQPSPGVPEEGMKQSSTADGCISSAGPDDLPKKTVASRMTKTLFWYIFGNLFRVFVMTTGALTGIMSFAVLLRPLTENGLDFGQVNRLLLYSWPAVCAYSLPVSAL